jgi:uncharacterized protein with PIN domain
LKLHRANFRFYEELNDFLPGEDHKCTLEYQFKGRPAIKDSIEAQGIPHTEVDLIVVDGESVDFSYGLKNGDRVAVYPVFESFDITPIVRLREKPLRNTAFIVDVNLGKLARRLRLLGFDTAYSNYSTDQQIVDLALNEKRIVLTRDRRLLFRKAITHGCWIRSVEVDTQIQEVLHRFDLHQLIRPFNRCLDCNGVIEPVTEKARIWSRLEPLTRRYYTEFYHCVQCDKIYWEGSHVKNMHKVIQQLRI